MFSIDNRLPLNSLDALLKRMSLPQAEPVQVEARTISSDRLLLSTRATGLSLAAPGRYHPLPPGERDEEHAALRDMASGGLDRADRARTDAAAREIANETLVQMRGTALGQDSMTLESTIAALRNVRSDATGAFLAKDALRFLASGHLSVEPTHLFDLAVETVQQAGDSADAYEIGVAFLETLERQHPDATIRRMATSGLADALAASSSEKAVASLLLTFNQMRMGKMQLA